MRHFKYHEKDFLQLQAERKAFVVLREWLTQIMESLHVPQRVMRHILVSSDELFTNIASYAYPSDQADKPVKIYLRYDEEQRAFIVTFKDWGVFFNPLVVLHEKPLERVQNKLIGGLGLFLVHHYMDDIQYERLEGQNVLSIIKKINDTAQKPECMAEPSKCLQKNDICH